MAADRRRNRRALLLLLLGGAVVIGGGKLLHLRVKAFQIEQRRLCEIPTVEPLKSSTASKKNVAVDSLFARRLAKILCICVPSVWAKEAFYIAVQTCLLYSRTLLTERIAALEGMTGQAVLSQDWTRTTVNMTNFARVAVPASLVNSGLKYMQVIINLSFQQRLTEYLHECYLSNRVYYVASSLGGLSNPDQRITEDVAKFSSAISELYSYTFKPVLDIIFFSRSLARTIGYKGQILLYGYFIFCSAFLRAISPPLALMTSQEAALSGNFRNAHQRVVSHAEEIAFNDPPGGDTERRILNDHLHRLMRHSRLSAIQRFLQQVSDGYMIKYTASIVGLCVFAAPFYYHKQKDSLLSTGEYIRTMRLLMNTSSAIGQLVLVYKRVTTLAGFTSRVSELLESVKQLSYKGQLRASVPEKVPEQEWALKIKKDGIQFTPPQLLFGDSIIFKNVTVYSPDGMLLVRELSFEVVLGESVLIMGPNGSGKSSLFRVLAELWQLQSGIIKRPPRGEIFYLSQRPYMVRGTLRDQIRYPAPPLDLLKEGNNISLSATAYYQNDAHMVEVLHATEIGYLLERGDGLDQIQNWAETLSGGEKQRLAVSRVLYHKPKFAVLDECTSAVSADGEENLCKQLHMNAITMLSIAHRPALKKYHAAILHLDRSLPGLGWKYEKIIT
eukprot:c21867_g1_i1 orf=307-2316(-)